MANEETIATSEMFQKILHWKSTNSTDSESLEIVVGVDIGATNVRVAISCANGVRKGESVELVKFKANENHQLLSKLHQLEEEFFHSKIFSNIVIQVVGACLAAAGPVMEAGRQVTITNYKEFFQVLNVNDLPKLLFPTSRTLLINDLEGTCEGIISLAQGQDIHEFFQPLWSLSSSNECTNQLQPINYVVLAMGTGLGCGLIRYDSSKGRHFVFPLETGHTTLTTLSTSNNNSKEEQSLLSYLSDRIYSGQFCIEWEDICSGRGLVHCYQWLTYQRKLEHDLSSSLDSETNLDAMEVARRALSSSNPDVLAIRAMYLHYSYLIRCAQQLCVGLVAKGVFLAGDNQVFNDPFVSEHGKKLEQDFLMHSKQAWLQGIPVFRQIKKYNLNLLGCIYVAMRIAAQGRIY